MGTTSRFGFRYPESGDQVDVAQDMRELAEDADGYASRLFECTSSTRPTGIPNGFVISETDTGLTYKRLAGAWVLIGGTSGGGGGGGGATGSYRASNDTAQSIGVTSSGPGTPVAFPDEDDADAIVTRASSGAGHKFTLNSSGIYAPRALVRIASTSQAGEVSLSMYAGSRVLDLDGGRREGLPRTLHVGACEYLAAGTELFVYCYNGTAGARLTEPNAGQWVKFSCALVA